MKESAKLDRELSEELPEENPAPLPQPAKTGLVVLDPLQRYLMEIRKYPLLKAEQQRELAIRYRNYGDIEAAVQLANSGLRLVVKIAMAYRRTYTNLLDLIQEGNVGLLQAVRKFDPYRGTKFSTYAVWWIRAYILKYILDNWSLVKFGTSNEKRKLFFNLKREKEKLEAAGLVAGPKLLAEKFGVTEQDVIDAEKVVKGRDLSLDEYVSDTQEERHIDFLQASSAPVDEKLVEDEYQALLKQKFNEFAKTLSEKERVIYQERLLAEEPKTLQDIGDRYHITRERVRQLEARLIKNLKAFLQKELPSFKGIRIDKVPQK
jgi:RNA polymerase sigma-32 factor